MPMIQLTDLVLDFDFYPRAEVDPQHVHYIYEAILAGVQLPAIIVDKKSKRIVDGFHRYRAYVRADEDAKVDIVFKSYKTDMEMFLDAMRYNAGHGRSLTKFDRVHCMIRADALHIELNQVAAALSMTTDAVGKLKVNRIGSLRVANRKVLTPLKRTIEHMTGKTLNKRQSEVNEKLSGMNQLFYVNQLTMLIETGLLDYDNTALLESLEKLAGLINNLQKQAAA